MKFDTSVDIRRWIKCFDFLFPSSTKVDTGPVDIRTARSKAVFLGRQLFNAVSVSSTAQVAIFVLPP